ncbi:MAG: type secretion protein [Gammaproteobacteria bacterium]|jgi:type IV secretion system protein VirB10|nr:type secretion protein [Gammaproteobacteria bacterium]
MKKEINEGEEVKEKEETAEEGQQPLINAVENDISEKASPLPLQGEKPLFSRRQTWGTVAIMACVFLQGWLFYSKPSPSTSDKTGKEAKEREETYRVSPFTRESKDPPVKAVLTSSLSQQQLLEQQIAAAKAKDFMDRLQVSQNVSSEEGGNGAQAIGMNPSSAQEPSGAFTRTPSNPNTAFLNEVSDATTQREYATLSKPLPYLVGQGKFIFGTLAVAIQSDLPGQIEAVVNHDVYGEQGKQILIPRGSHLIGEYRSTLRHAQTRLFTVWTRIKEPNGVDIRLGSEGTDSLGRAGMTGQVDAHFFERFGSAMLISMISAGAATSGVSTQDPSNSASAYRQSVSHALAEEAKNTLGENLPIPPTLYVPQGERIVVFVNRDLDFSKVYSRE